MLAQENERVLLKHADIALEKLKIPILEGGEGPSPPQNLSDLLEEYVAEFRKKKKPKKKKLKNLNSTNIETLSDGEPSFMKMEYEEELDSNDDCSESEVEVDDYFRRLDSNLGKKVKKNQPEFL